MQEEKRIYLSTMKKDDINFLMELWYKLNVMRYADEFPSLRGWDKTSDKEEAWEKYQAKRVIHGNDYAQLIIKLRDCTSIGGSFYAPFYENFTYCGWEKPENEKVLMGDIKLLPNYWNQGIGTEGAREVVKFAFDNTDCDKFIVPPHKENLGAIRVYEKSGFEKLKDLYDDDDRILMKMTRERFKELYKELD